MHRFICRLNDSENQNVVALVNIMYSDTHCTSQFWGHWYKCLLKMSHKIIIIFLFYCVFLNPFVLCVLLLFFVWTLSLKIKLIYLI